MVTPAAGSQQASGHMVRLRFAVWGLANTPPLYSYGQYLTAAPKVTSRVVIHGIHRGADRPRISATLTGNGVQRSFPTFAFNSSKKFSTNISSPDLISDPSSTIMTNRSPSGWMLYAHASHPTGSGNSSRGTPRWRCLSGMPGSARRGTKAACPVRPRCGGCGQSVLSAGGKGVSPTLLRMARLPTTWSARRRGSVSESHRLGGHRGYRGVGKDRSPVAAVRYIDYLSLLKIDGQWKIVSKIWYQEAPGGGAM